MHDISNENSQHCIFRTLNPVPFNYSQAALCERQLALLSIVSSFFKSFPYIRFFQIPQDGEKGLDNLLLVL
jgi:hypothetical protein